MTMLFKILTQSINTLNQLKHVITYNIWSDLGSNNLKELSADDSHIKVERKVKIHRTNFNLPKPLMSGLKLGPNCLKELSADANVI